MIREEKEKNPSPYRAVYVLNKSFVNNDGLCPDIRVIEPRKDDHGRLVNQAGLFTYSPLESTIEDTLTNTLSADSFPDDALRSADEDEQAEVLARYICKIYIKNEDREGCLRHLWLMNVHHASLFPDLQGAAEYCNGQIGFKRGFEVTPASAALEPVEVPDDEPDDDVTPPTPAPVVPVVEARSVEPTLSFVTAPPAIDVPTLESILWECMGSFKTGPERVAKLAVHLARDLPTAMVVDWDKRDSGIARVRLFVRQLLRTYHYPAPLLSLAVDNVVLYLRGLPLPDFLEATRAAEANAPSPEQVKRLRDVEQLRKVFQWISLDAMNRFLYRLNNSGWLTNEGHFLWERLGWLLESSKFYLSDTELRERLITFMKAWGKCFTHFDHMEQHRGGEVFFFNVKDGDEWKYCRDQNQRAKFNGEQAAPLKEALDAFIGYVEEHYLEIDPDTAGAEGLAAYKEDEAQTKKIIRLTEESDRIP
ncbi:MAG: DUF3387 domain-containing protein [Prosthecobacter sp.]